MPICLAGDEIPSKLESRLHRRRRDLLSDRADSAHVVLVPMPSHATVYALAVARSARSCAAPAAQTGDQHSDRPLPSTWILQARLFRVSWSKTDLVGLTKLEPLTSALSVRLRPMFSKINQRKVPMD